MRKLITVVNVLSISKHGPDKSEEQKVSIENMLPLRWFYTLVNAHLCVLKLEASTYIYEPHSIVTSAAINGRRHRPEGRIIVVCAVYAQVCIPEQ